MNRMLLKNALIVTKDDMFQGDLEIENGVISAIGLCGSFREEEETLDAAGRMVIPGLIDPHVHIKHPRRISNVEVIPGLVNYFQFCRESS